MRAAISLLVLLLSMCGVQTESHGTDAFTQDVSTELKELRDMVVELKASLRHTGTRDEFKVLEAENVAVKGRLVASERKVEALERALQDTKAEMKMEVDNLKKENAAQESEVTAVKTRLAATETKGENLEKDIKAVPKVAFSAGLRQEFGGISTGKDFNLVFKKVITNVGGAYSSVTGYFRAPVRGVYYFRFTVMDRPYPQKMSIRMHKNGQQLMYLYDYGSGGWASYLSSGLALQLERGDVVNMVLPSKHSLFDDSNYQSTFSGFLLFPL